MCKWQFPSLTKLDDHNCKPRIQDQVINCRYCSHHFEEEETRRSHEDNCRTDKCKICDKWMKAKNLMRHMKSVHIDGTS